MSRVNDVGGQAGFGALEIEADEPPFHADWEARVFALNSALVRNGVYRLDEFRDAVERMAPQEYLAASYYERWLHAIETLLAERGCSAMTEFRAGERVRVRAVDPVGHTRVPRYVRGQVGRIVECQGRWALADESAAGVAEPRRSPSTPWPSRRAICGARAVTR